jgi:transposase
LRQFAIEAEIRGQPPTARLAARQQRSLAELDALKAFLERELVRVSGKSTLAQTIRYALFSPLVPIW